MNVKGASFFQLHIEKIVLGVGVLFLTVTIAVVMLGIPWRVKLGNNTYNSPQEVIPELVRNRERLEEGLADTNQIDADYVAPDMLRDYVRLDTAGVTGGSPLVGNMNSPGPDPSKINPDEPDALRYAQPTPPMPNNIKVFSSFDVLDIEDQALANKYFALWNQQRVPADFDYVFIEGEFSNYDWVLKLIGEEGQTDQIPVGIWEKRLGIASVYLVRQELNPQTGLWENTVVVKKLPSQLRVMPTDVESDQGQYPESLIAQIQNSQDMIRLTPTPPLTDRHTMMTPREFDVIENPYGDLTDEEIEAAEDAERQRLRDEERARRDEEQRQQREERNNRNRPGGGGGLGEPGRGLGPGGAGGRGRGSQAPGGMDQFGDLGIAGILPAPRQTSSGFNEVAQQGLEIPPGDGGGRTRPGRGSLNPGGRGNPGLEPGGLGGPQVGDRGGNGAANPDVWRVWALDVTVEPGKTYRYKLVAAVVNPLYGVNGLADDQLEANRHMASLAPSQEDFDETDWTDPIVIAPKAQFFVVQARDSSVNVEVWRVFDGERVKEEFRVSPGDPIGGGVIRGAAAIDMRTGATVVDIDRRKDINGQVVFTLIFIDADGVLHERSVQEDQSSPDRRRLEQEFRDQREGILPGRPNPQGDQPIDPGFGPGFGPGQGLENPGLAEPGLGRPGRDVPGRSGPRGR